ncbi:MAG: anthranilate synthase component I [Acidimicrobiales bacterium]
MDDPPARPARPGLTIHLGESSPGADAAPTLRCAPGPAEFRRLAAEHRIVPVWSEVVADTLTPVAAFRHVVGDGVGFLLESVEGGERWGRFSFVGRAPLATVVTRGRTVSATGPLAVPTGEDGVLAALETLLDTDRSPSLDGLPPLFAGVVGYLGYDVVREVEHLPDVPPDDQGFPDAGLVVIGQLCAFDHWRQRVVLVDNVVVDDAWGNAELDAAYREAATRLEALAADCLRPTIEVPIAPPDGRPPAADVARTMTSRGYQDAVRVAKEYIEAGDIFQVVLSQRYDVDLRADPFDVYRCLRLLNPSPYLYFLRLAEVTVVGSSPEPMVRLRDGVVTSRPIAGSRPRGRSESEDELAAGQLIEDPKELAEHVMLVDLARNDVGRVVQFGTEKVDEFMTVERYSHIMHLTSQVTGELREDRGPIDVLRATLPAGTLSGAPKVRAMEIIDELEPTKRGIYGGVVGYLDFSGNLDTAIAIRTMVVAPDGRASVQAGAGIVADSDPETEDAECAHKAAALLAALAAAREITEARAAVALGRP